MVQSSKMLQEIDDRKMRPLIFRASHALATGVVCFGLLKYILNRFKQRRVRAGLAVVCAGFFRSLFKRLKQPPSGIQEVPWTPIATNWPLLGHVPAVLKHGADSMDYGEGRLAKLSDDVLKTGIVKINFFGTVQNVVMDEDLVSEAFKRNYQAGGPIGKDFDVFPVAPMFKYSFGHGLFTASDHDPHWGKAHRILIKPFSRQGMMAFVPLMNQQADDMVIGMERDIGIGNRINLYTYTQKMAVETICICAMGTSFGSFNSDEPHPFILTLMGYLQDFIKLALTPKPLWIFKGALRRKLRSYEDTMIDIAKDIIKKRRAGETKSATTFPDLLDHMLSTPDPETGEMLDDDTVRFNIFTFLLAGQDSTAAAMSSFFSFLAAKPHVEERLLEEIRTVVGDGDVTWQQLQKMKYLDWTQKETLRMIPPVTSIRKTAYEDCVLGGKWKIKKGEAVILLPQHAGLNEEKWGWNADEFVPERWETGTPSTSSFMPFSHGPRACIGKEFTLLEQKICIVKVLQKFSLKATGEPLPEQQGMYIMKRGKKFETLTPNVGMDVYYNPLLVFTGCQSVLELHARPKIASPTGMLQKQTTTTVDDNAGKQWKVTPENHGTPLLILYGSDGGSTTTMAEDVLATAESLGFLPRLATLDDLANSAELKSGDVKVLILTATYNGDPPKNATNFVSWMREAKAKYEQPISSNMQYAVLGVGNSNWEATFQAIPIMVDSGLAEMGAFRFLPLHTVDNNGDAESEVAAWNGKVWPALCAASGLQIESDASGDMTTTMAKRLPDVAVMAAGAEVEPLVMSYENSECMQATVVVNAELQKAGGAGSTRHLEVDISDVQYQTGDHLGVYPQNDPALVDALMSRMGLEPDTVICWKTGGNAQSLRSPIADGKGRKLADVLSRSVDLVKPATVGAVQLMASKCDDLMQAVHLKGFDKEVIKQSKATVLELLQKFPAVNLSLPELIFILPPMQRRFYSISSSPLMSKTCSITVGVVEGKSPTGRVHQGVCSNYLKNAKPGDKIWVEVKDTGSSFRLPSEPKKPVLLIGPGTGLAPLRGFLQEIQAQKAKGVEMGAAHLFFGCQTHEKFLYEDELKAFEVDGTLASLNVAFSRSGGKKEYVQDHIAKQAALVWDVLQNSGHIYVCGDASRMAPDVRCAIKQAVITASGMSESEASRFIDQLCAVGTHRRYHEDVWASS